MPPPARPRPRRLPSERRRRRGRGRNRRPSGSPLRRSPRRSRRSRLARPAGAFAAAGYTFEDAQVLAAFWGIDSELEVEAVAGELLAAGTPLAESPFADPAGAEGSTSEELADLLLASGYDGEDASVLAEAWGVSVDEAESRAGTELKVVGVLPFVDPDPQPVPVEAGDGTLAPEFEAYFAAGYYYEDSPLLAEHWGMLGFEEAKFEAGRLILAGQPLPDVSGVAPH